MQVIHWSVTQFNATRVRQHLRASSSASTECDFPYQAPPRSFLPGTSSHFISSNLIFPNPHLYLPPYRLPSPSINFIFRRFRAYTLCHNHVAGVACGRLLRTTLNHACQPPRPLLHLKPCVLHTFWSLAADLSLSLADSLPVFSPPRRHITVTMSPRAPVRKEYDTYLPSTPVLYFFSFCD